jgi:hypothetical protein|tara:strand:- start:36 stop:182 length:147 start_codon:yes stop_codon:yes gene_type:complete
MKFKLPKMPKMPNVVGKAKDLAKRVGSGVKSTTKSATAGVKNLNPFKK